jgi:hypothetical protein
MSATKKKNFYDRNKGWMAVASLIVITLTLIVAYLTYTKPSQPELHPPVVGSGVSTGRIDAQGEAEIKIDNTVTRKSGDSPTSTGISTEDIEACGSSKVTISNEVRTVGEKE